jgi:hypothetical protein
MTFNITAQGDFSAEKAAADLRDFFNKEMRIYDLEIIRFSDMPLSAVISIPQNKKHDLRIALNLFAAETGIDWRLESLNVQ